MRKMILVLALALIAASPALADLEYRLDPCNGSDWSVGSQHTVTLQAHSTAGPVTLYSVEVWMNYLESDLGTYVGALRLDGGTNLVPAGELDSTSSSFANDGEINYSQYVGGSAPGAVVDATWRDLASFTFTVLEDTPHLFHFVMNFNFLFAFDTSFNEIAGAGVNCGTGWAPGEYNGDPTAIELVSFNATGAQGQVDLAWETATESNNAGFHLWRADSESGTYAKITADLIPSEGGPTGGSVYAYTDDGLTAGKTYWYKLEDVDLHGQSTFHGPVSATVLRKPLFGCGMAGGSDKGLLAGLLGLIGLVVVRRAARRG